MATDLTELATDINELVTHVIEVARDVNELAINQFIKNSYVMHSETQNQI